MVTEAEISTTTEVRGFQITPMYSSELVWFTWNLEGYLAATKIWLQCPWVLITGWRRLFHLVDNLNLVTTPKVIVSPAQIWLSTLGIRKRSIKIKRMIDELMNRCRPKCDVTWSSIVCRSASSLITKLSDTGYWVDTLPPLDAWTILWRWRHTPKKEGDNILCCRLIYVNLNILTELWSWRPTKFFGSSLLTRSGLPGSTAKPLVPWPNSC